MHLGVAVAKEVRVEIADRSKLRREINEATKGFMS